MVMLARLLILVAVLGWMPAEAQEDPYFTVDGLNAGLGDPPAGVDRRTPRAALATFLRAAREDDWDTAAHALDLADTAEAEQPVDGPILARYLYSVIERKAVLDWSQLNERPDGLQVLGGSQQAQAGEPRRSFLLRELNLDPVPASIRLNRLKPGEDADPVWVFSRETVVDLPALYAEYGPSPWEARLPQVLREKGPWGLLWWEWAGLPLLTAAAILLAIGLWRAIDIARKSSTRGLVRGLLYAVRVPAVLIAVTALVSWGTETIFIFSGTIDTVLSPLIAIGYVTAILMLVMGAIDAILDNLVAPGGDVDLTETQREDARATATRLNAAKRILGVLVFLIGAGVVLATADVFRGLGLSLLASAGALTLVLGFAARDVLGNIMSSLQIALNQSARVGDRIVWEGELCYVERIHLTFLQLRNWDDTRVIVPVREFVSGTFHNWTLEGPEMLKILKFKLAPSTDLEVLRERFLAILRELRDGELDGDLGEIDDAAMNVTGQDVFGVDVWFSVPCDDANSSWTVACTVRERLIAAMRDLATEERPVFPDVKPGEAA